ncbi:MAG: HAD family hydrolase [Prochlorococcaceae cyanobacterium]
MADPLPIPFPPSPSRAVLQDQITAALPPEPELVLVTDLDGTLLGGEPSWRQALYGWLRQHRLEVLHIYCTGRQLASIEALLADERSLGLPHPHLVIGDVGCTVACGTSLRTVPAMVDPIEARWQGLPERLLPLMEGLPGVEPQPIHTERRLAYTLTGPGPGTEHMEAIRSQGVDVIVSDDRYLDVLPPGVNKGSTLLALLEWLEIGHGQVVTAGDTLNDLAMFETGLDGVMVGNAEPALVEKVEAAGFPRLYRARGEGCAGIVEGLHHFGYGPLLADLPVPAA